MFSANSLAALLLAASAASGGEVLDDVPGVPDASKTYVLYLHGRVVEDQGPHAHDPRFGDYDYPAVLEALGARGATVISARRPHGTDMDEYAGHVLAQIERLIAAGVPETRIAVVGFSKGGGIAIRVSSFLRRDGVRFALLAACPGAPQHRLTGRVLSVLEASDTLAQSCRPMTEHAEKPAAFEEITISTGKRHGAFYQPRSEWVQPVLDWVGEAVPVSSE